MDAVMARPKKKAGAKGGRPASPNPKRRVISFRCSEDFGEWFDELAEESRIPPATILELAVIEWAKKTGFQSEPPKR